MADFAAFPPYVAMIANGSSKQDCHHSSASTERECSRRLPSRRSLRDGLQETEMSRDPLEKLGVLASVMRIRDKRHLEGCRPT